MNNQQVIGNIILEAMTTSEPKVIRETAGRVEATGILQDLGVENRNGRIYELKDIKPEIEGDRIQKELIPAGQMFGELGHPCTSELSRQSVIDPKNVCVRFTKIWIEGNDVHGNFKGTNNDLGATFNADLLEGYKPAFSLRALGSVERDRNGKCYVRNLKIICYDSVVYPSHKRAYTTGLISANESAILTPNSNYNSATVLENGMLIPIVNQQVVDYIKHESANVKSILSNFESLYESAIIVNNGRQVQLTLPSGDRMLINLEQYISDEIMNYCWGGGGSYDRYFNEMTITPSNNNNGNNSNNTQNNSTPTPTNNNQPNQQQQNGNNQN